MFGKNTAGIFIGTQGLSLVESTGAGKIKNYLYNPYPKDITSPAGINLPKDSIFNVFLDNEVEIIAFLQRSIRDSKIDLERDDVVVCIPNRDLIVRFFEMPPIPRKEIDASIGFEIKKYIPFKIEDIAYDYQVESGKNIIEVLFAGIKNEDLNKYISILNQLNPSISIIEPAQFSLLRLLKIKKIITDKEAVVIVELEHQDSSISIVDKGIPCFSRDVKIPVSAEAAEQDKEAISFRIINEVRVSIDYFRRQFLKKNINRIIILSKDESKELINNFNKELGTPVFYKNPDEICGIKEENSLNITKALGASFRVTKPSSLIIDLGRRQKPQSKTLLLSKPAFVESLQKILSDIPKAVIINSLAFVCFALVAVYLFSDSKIKPFNQQLVTVSKEADSVLTGSFKGLDADSIASLKRKTEERLNVFKEVFRKDFLISEKLEVLPTLMPEGAWLEEISYSRSSESVYFRGIVYKANEKEAADAAYKFISNLKSSPLFSNKVANISVRSLKSGMQNNYKIIRFEIDIRLDF